MSRTHIEHEGPPAGGPATPATRVTRRELLQMGNALALPVLMHAASTEAAAATGPLTPGPRIYQSIGVEPIINCRGTFTIIGGSVERPEVRAAMDAASRYYVQMDELAEGVGRRLAELTGAEWGMVSAGCAAGLKHVTAACVTGGDPEKLQRIPHISGLEKTEVIMPRSSRTAYDFAIRNIGVTMITVDTPEQFQDALSSRTAMIYLQGGPASSGPLSLEAIAQMVAPRRIPILVDAAAEVLTIPNVHLQRGATVVAYSGGKAICGPQCAGLVLGRKDLLMSAWQASAPHHGPGRDNKVGREETLGMVAAVEAWVTRDHAADWKTWLGWLDTIARRVSSIDGVKTAVREPTGLSNRSPSLTISWDPARLHVSGEDVADELATTKPRIAVGAGGREGDADPGLTSISITAWMMQPGDERVVADRVHEVLARRRAPASTTSARPAADLSGQWDVTVEFFSSTGRHTLYVEQDGNWLRGSHQTEFSTRELVGMIEGDEVTLRSAGLRPAPTFIFTGRVSGDTITGPLHMGEYLNARFTAKRHAYTTTRSRIRVPSGPPLAT